MSNLCQQKSKIFKISRFLLVFVLMAGWIFSGMWQIWQNPQIPPKIQKARAGTVTYDTAATHIWHSPVGVTSVDIECWGAGGAGGGSTSNKDGAGGGGGGAYAKKTGIAISADTDYNVVVGAGGVAVDGAAGGNGGDSYFDAGADVLAKAGLGGGAAISTGGVGGAGGTGSTGTTTCDGGTGGYGRDNNTGAGGPGGTSAGTGSVGVSGDNPWTSSSALTAPAGGGDGGAGHPGVIGDGSPGVAPGGGGGGSAERVSISDASIGGNGAVGKCILTWTDPSLATTIAIRSQDYAASVSGITFPAGDPSAVVSLPTNGVGVEVQTFSATPGDAEPVVTLVNTVATAYNIWYNITAFSNGVVSSENYVIIAKGGACANADAITESATLDGSNHMTTNGSSLTTIAATGELDLYLKITLGTSWGKTGTSTLTILGETQ